MGLASSIGIFILFYKRDDEEKGIELYKENGKTNLYGTLVLKVLPPIMVVFNILGLVAATKGIIYAVTDTISPGRIEFVISVSLFGLNHMLAFYQAGKLQTYFRYANFYYILYVFIVAFKDLSPFQTYPFFIIIWFTGFVVYLNYISIKENSYRKIPKLIIIFAAISFMPFIGMASNDYFTYLTEKNAPYHEDWGRVNEKPSTFTAYMSGKINKSHDKAPYKYYTENKNEKKVPIKANHIYFSAGYIFSDDRFDYDISKFTTLSPFETHAMEWGKSYRLKNFVIETNANELMIKDGNNTIWSLDIEATDDEKMLNQVKNGHFLEIKSDSGIILISELSITGYGGSLRWSIKGLIIN